MAVEIMTIASGEDTMTDDAAGAVQVAEPTGELSGYPVPAQPVPPAGLDAEDRLWIHAAWEGVLLILLAGGIGLWWLFGGDTELLTDPQLLGERMYAVAPYLLLATALAVSIRVRAANLAVGAVAALAAVLFVEWESESQLAAVGLVLAAAVAAGLGLAVLVIGLRIPGWAASLGVLVAATAAAVTIEPPAGGVLAPVIESTTVTVGDELVWVVVGAVMAVSVLGGVIGVLPAVRQRLQACREAAAEPGRRDRPAVLTVGGALLGSCLLAAAAGVLLVLPVADGPDGAPGPAGALEPVGLAVALAIVLFGGTSMWGKRGGVFGTLLAALAVFAVVLAFDELGWADQRVWIVVGALALGFAVTWLVEAYGTRRLVTMDSLPLAADEAEEPA